MAHQNNESTDILCGQLTVSTTRTEKTDESGEIIRDFLTREGHKLAESQLVPDDPDKIKEKLKDFVNSEVRVLIITGGTGLSRLDQSVDVLARMEDKKLPGFGELFRALSYEDIGPRSVLSRARGSLLENTLVFALPGSPAAVKLGMEKIIGPVLGHAIYEVDKETN